MKNCAVILGAGSGSRMGAGMNKVFLPLDGVPLIIRSIAPFTSICEAIFVVSAPGEEETMSSLLVRYGLSRHVTGIITGGATRQESVYRALQALPDDADYVLIHDGARALVTEEIILASLRSAERFGSGIAAIPVTDTLKRTDGKGLVLETPDRRTMFAVQTPQTFRAGLIRNAYEEAKTKGIIATDDSSLAEAAGEKVHLSAGSSENIKLTTPTDLKLARLILEEREEKR